MPRGAEAFGDFARQQATEQATAVSMAELAEWQRQQADKRAEDAQMFEYLQNVVQPETPAPGQGSVPMAPQQIAPPSPGPMSAGPQVPGPPSPFTPPPGMPPGLGLPPGMPGAPPGAPPPPAMPPPGWKGPSPAASPALGGPAGGGGSPAVGASPVAAGTAPPAGLPTPQGIAMPPPGGPAGAAAGVPGMIPAQQKEQLPGVEKITPIPVDQIYAKIASDPKLSATQKYHVMAKVLAVANNQNDQLLKKMESRAYVQERAAAAARDAALEWKAMHSGPRAETATGEEKDARRIQELEDQGLTHTTEYKLLVENYRKRNNIKGTTINVGGGKETGMELIYPKGKDGLPDQTKDPIGSRGFTKDGKLVVKDLDGNVTSMAALGGGTPKEAKAAKVGVTNVVRQNIVKSGVTNSLARLDEIEKRFPNSNTSAFFGQAAENPATRALYGAGRSGMSSNQKQTDAMWASFIDEAIPVFTGGLRGSDAFRRFLIEQAPGPGDDTKTRAEKRRLMRANINGTNKAFFNQFVSDPKMWPPGTSGADIEKLREGGGATSESGADGDWTVERQ